MEVIVYYGQIEFYDENNDFDFFCRRKILEEQFPQMLGEFNEDVEYLNLASLKPEEKIYLFDEKRWITAEEIRILLSRW